MFKEIKITDRSKIYLYNNNPGIIDGIFIVINNYQKYCLSKGKHIYLKEIKYITYNRLKINKRNKNLNNIIHAFSIKKVFKLF